jgi:hypothetical protein
MALDVNDDVADILQGRQLVAIKTFTMGGTNYNRGDVVDVTGLSPAKVSQLLDQRWLRLGDPVSASAKSGKRK